MYGTSPRTSMYESRVLCPAGDMSVQQWIFGYHSQAKVFYKNWPGDVALKITVLGYYFVAHALFRCYYDDRAEENVKVHYLRKRSHSKKKKSTPRRWSTYTLENNCSSISPEPQYTAAHPRNPAASVDYSITFRTPKKIPQPSRIIEPQQPVDTAKPNNAPRKKKKKIPTSSLSRESRIWLPIYALARARLFHWLLLYGTARN